MLYIDTRASLPDDLLMVGDKTSMANSLEVRVSLPGLSVDRVHRESASRFEVERLDGKVSPQKGTGEMASEERDLPQEKGI